MKATSSAEMREREEEKEDREDEKDSGNTPLLCLFVTKESSKNTAAASSPSGRSVGAALRRKLPRKCLEDKVMWEIELFDFADNDQLSNVDNLLIQVGSCSLLLPEDFQNKGHAEGKKIRDILLSYEDSSINVSYCKKSLFKRNEGDVSSILSKIVGISTHNTNCAEVERPLGSACLRPLAQYADILTDTDAFGSYTLSFGSLNQYMRLDSAAASAINLFPKPDDPSPYGSIFGILNKCKTKMGTRLLDRWLRQPLLDVDKINRRLDVVELLKTSTMARNRLVDTALKGLPDVDNAIKRLSKENADLSGVFRLYTFTRGLPTILGCLQELQEEFTANESDDRNRQDQLSYMNTKFTTPLSELIQSFELLQQLVEHVVDFDRLPDLVVAAKHDPELVNLQEDMQALEKEARGLQSTANSTWGSFTEVKLESSAQLGFFFRTTRGDDERQLRQSSGKVDILSLQKNGVHFTTPRLSSISSEYLDLDAKYRKQQAAVVRSAVETVRTYLPVVESCAQLIAELDVLTSFATVAALAPSPYTRPLLHPLRPTEPAERSLLLRGARHPCVELMDQVEFIANDYELRAGRSSFQLITGPNMGGKSTYLRALGSLVLLAQVGSFVPCDFMEGSLVEALLARVGAGDAAQKGVSTFMAEMLEASVLVQTATPASLVLIDELGRGTSTVEGFGLAWGIAQYLASKVGAFCLFATHFYELTALEKHEESVVNKHVSAFTGEDNEIVMLHNIVDGPCSESFGIHVAKMAGFPDSVVSEAKRKAAELESQGAEAIDGARLQKVQKALRCLDEIPISNMPLEEAKKSIQAVFS